MKTYMHSINRTFSPMHAHDINFKSEGCYPSSWFEVIDTRLVWKLMYP